jgi:hypothetical protein
MLIILILAPALCQMDGASVKIGHIGLIIKFQLGAVDQATKLLNFVKLTELISKSQTNSIRFFCFKMSSQTAFNTPH